MKQKGAKNPMPENLSALIEKLDMTGDLEKSELIHLLTCITKEGRNLLEEKARKARKYYYGDAVYMRGLLEFTNYCKNTCCYCGIRNANTKVERYRLSEEDILECIKTGYDLGYRTIVMQGGEDPYFTDGRLVKLITSIKDRWSEIAITLSIGEKKHASYKAYYDAGVERYLLRHETATKELYEALHPGMSFENRRRCLYNLKDIGYQVGTGFIVGLPGQTKEDLVNDLMFIKELQPHMVGIGPFIPQKDTPLGNEKSGTVEETTLLIALLRLLKKDVLLPATTALGSIDPLGREKGLKAGANIVMPNLSPTDVRGKYALYDGKICTGDEAAHCRGCIEGRIKRAGFTVDMGRGDHISFKK